MRINQLFISREKWMKKILVSVMAIAIAVVLYNSNVSAATDIQSSVCKYINENAPIVTYATPSNGASKVYAYSDSTLKTKQTSYYICTYTDQIVIRKLSSDCKAVQCTYPSSSSTTGYRTKWFRAIDILGSDFNISYTYSNIEDYGYNSYLRKAPTYRLASASTVKSYGTIATGDNGFFLGKITVGGKTYHKVIYPISSVKVNGVNGCRYKLALRSCA